MQKGFMLFELMLVMGIVVVCCTIAFISYSSSKALIKGTSFSTDIALISLLLQSAGVAARCLNRQQTITFNAQESSMRYNNQLYRLSSGYRFDVLPDVYGPPSAPDKRVTQPVTFRGGTLTAHPDGTLQSGTLYITDGVNQYAITTPVSSFSYIRSYRYRNKQWQKYS